MFHTIKGIRFWQTEESVSKWIKRAINPSYRNRMLEIYFALFILGILVSITAFVMIGITPEAKIAPVVVPIISTLVPITLIAVFVDDKLKKHARIEREILESRSPWSTSLLIETDPIFKTIFPDWLYRKYLKDIPASVGVPTALKAALSRYWTDAQIEKVKYTEQRANAKNDLVALEKARFKYQAALIKLAKDVVPFYELAFGVDFGNHYQSEDAWNECVRKETIKLALKQLDDEIKALEVRRNAAEDLLAKTP